MSVWSLWILNAAEESYWWCVMLFSFSVSHVIINSYTMYTNQIYISLGDLIYLFGWLETIFALRNML